MSEDNNGRTDEFCEEIRSRLLQLGYEVAESDEEALDFAADRTVERIKNLCNTDRIPDTLELKAVDMACGEFLSGKMVFGGLDSYIESDGKLIKTISEGDTSVTYMERKSCAQRIEEFIAALCGNDSEIISCRRLKW